MSDILKKMKFGVFGLGISGISTIKFLQKQQANFIAYDDNHSQIDFLSNSEPELIPYFENLESSKWSEIDYLILSPGISKNHLVAQIAMQNNVKIICDIELFYLLNRKCFYIGITGTNGKSTTTSLIGHILKFNGIKSEIGGNIGRPVMDIVPEESCVYVFEVSSYQLEMIDETRFNVATILNITPDHLDRHGTMENYTQAKYRIFKNAENIDKLIINSELPHTKNMITFSSHQESDFLLKNNVLYFNNESYSIPENPHLKGDHNQENMASAIACCFYYGLSIEKIIKAIPSFVGLKHRMQFLGIKNGITFVNDSKATNAESTSHALKSYNNILWIVGGVAKEEGIEPLKKYFGKVKLALLIGASQDDFAHTCGQDLSYIKCETLENAIKVALDHAKNGDVMLLSPACASFDQWKNFEARGNFFIDQINKIL